MLKYLCYYLFFSYSFTVFASDAIIGVKGNSIVNFGSYQAKERKEATFRIVNNGNAVLKIGNIRKTCGCAEAKIDKKEIKPGEFGTLRAVVLKDSIYGGYRKNIYVESNDPKQRFLTLTIAGNAIPILKIKPKANIYVGTIPANMEWVQEFILEATEKGVKLGNPKIKSAISVKTVITSQSEMKFHLKVTIKPDVKGGMFKCKIKIPVIEPKGWKGVELIIIGKTL